MDTVVRMRPSDLRYTHDSIGSTFTNGTGLEETFEELLYDNLSIIDMPNMVAMYFNGDLYVVRGNRRLFIYQALEDAGKISRVNVKCIQFEQNLFCRHHTTETSGVSVRIRGRPFGSVRQKLKDIVNTWTSKPFMRRKAKVSPIKKDDTRSCCGFCNIWCFLVTCVIAMVTWGYLRYNLFPVVFGTSSLYSTYRQ